MTLRKYKNPLHRMSNGKCCDHLMFNFGRCYPCDAYFKLCVSQSVTGSSAYSCNIGRSKTGVVGDRDNHTPNIRRVFSFGTFQVGAFIRTLRKTRRQRQRERHQTMAVHEHYNSWYISLPSSVNQQREMTSFFDNGTDYG